jgi:hypothetical protein
VAVAVGDYHILGLKADGSIIGWGRNDYGQCNIPSPNTGFIAVAAGWYHSLGLKSDGSIVAWGYNSSGQCNVPSPNSDFVAVAAGGKHSLGLKADGSIIAWGLNDWGQCNVPAPNTGFVAIAAKGGSWTEGGAYSLGLKADGSIVAWGRNNYGLFNVPLPNTGFVAVAAGEVYSLGLRGGQLAMAFKIRSAFPTHAGNSGSALIKIIGSGFKQGATVKLQAAVQLDANEVDVFSPFLLKTRFNLAAAPVGKYDVVVTNPDGSSVTLPQSFEIIEGGEPNLWTKLTVPPEVRPGRSYTAYIEYGNDGQISMPIPIFHISNSREVPMQIGRYGRQSSIGLALLGIGPEGFRTELLPGSISAIPITFVAPNTNSVEFRLTTYLPDANAFPWDDLEAIVRPPYLTDEQWVPEWTRLIGNMGSTWQEVIDDLGPVLEELPQVDAEVSSDLVSQMTFALWAYDQPPDGNLYGTGYLESQVLDSYMLPLGGDVYGNFDPVNDVNIIPDRFDPCNTCTYIITHGWRKGASDMADLAQRSASHCSSCNVLRVNWKKGAATVIVNPQGAAENIEPAGQEAYNKLSQLFGQSFDWNQVTFIGHSFGNGVNKVISQAAGRKGQAIVLDPANYWGGYDPRFSNFYQGGSLAVITDSLADNGPCWPRSSPRRIADRQLHLPSDIGGNGHGRALECFTEQIDPCSPNCNNPWLTGTLFQSVPESPAGWYDGEIDCQGQLTISPFPACSMPWDLLNPVNIVIDVLSTVIHPIDPSEKRGTIGYDPNGTPLELCRHFVKPDAPLEYTVFFENEPNATAPAQEVRIVDYLNPSLDWTTLELGEIVFGDQVVTSLAGNVSGQTTVPLPDSNYVVDINAQFNVYNGQVTWLLRTIDPNTGDLPEDPLAGFLPPNDANHRGEGHVCFSIYPQQDLPNARIPNKATIFFDTEAPFDVNVWLNAIDGSPPASAVLPFPPLSIPTRFEVQWSGNDGQGCGIAGYDIYVSTNSEPNVPWILNTSETNSIFVGVPGNTYRFYCVAHDFLENVELEPVVPDAETTLRAIDFYFFARFANRWLDDDCNVPDWCDGMDFNGNHVVDLDDIAILAVNWLATYDFDLCPDDPNKIQPGTCGCGVPDFDVNGDGIMDCGFRYGDIDGDAEITAYDAALALQCETLSEIQKFAADVDGNSCISDADAQLIAQYAVGLITIFPVEQMNPKPTTVPTCGCP